MIHEPITKQQLRDATDARLAIEKKRASQTTARIINACGAPRSHRDAAYEESVGNIRAQNNSYTYSMRSFQREALQC